MHDRRLVACSDLCSHSTNTPEHRGPCPETRDRRRTSTPVLRGGTSRSNVLVCEDGIPRERVHSISATVMASPDVPNPSNEDRVARWGQHRRRGT